MPYNFDEIIERKGTNCIKYDFACERGKPDDLLPLWVADMDFRTPPEVVDALVAAVSTESSVTQRSRDLILKRFITGIKNTSAGRQNKAGW